MTGDVIDVISRISDELALDRPDLDKLREMFDEVIEKLAFANLMLLDSPRTVRCLEDVLCVGSATPREP